MRARLFPCGPRGISVDVFPQEYLKDKPGRKWRQSADRRSRRLALGAVQNAASKRANCSSLREIVTALERPDSSFSARSIETSRRAGEEP